MFHSLKQILWPIEKSELKFFAPLASIMFCALFNFSVIRSLKDSIIVPILGAEAISFLKLWLVLPIAVIVTIIYAKLSNIFAINHIYYSILAFFCIIFLLFAYHLYPYQHLYHIDEDLANKLISQYQYLKWPIKIFAKWSYALMYVVADLWSAVIINLIFWQLCNHFINQPAAKRFYPTFGMIGNMGLIFGGITLIILSDASFIPDSLAVAPRINSNEYLLRQKGGNHYVHITNDHINHTSGIDKKNPSQLVLEKSDTKHSDFIVVKESIYNSDYDISTQKSLQSIITVVCIVSLLSMFLLKLFDKNVSYTLKNSKDNEKQVLNLQHSTSANKQIHSSKTTLSLKESLNMILQSKYILRITLMVMCYGLAINILEGPWKAQIRKVYPDYIHYIDFMGKFNIMLGIGAILFAFVGNWLFQRYSWIFAALFTPVIVGVTGSMFFILLVFGEQLNEHVLIIDSAFAAVFIGACQNLISKASKYTIFDAAKEVTYIPLSVELKSKGKAAAEVVGYKFGKSMGAFLQSGIFVFFPFLHFEDISFYLMIVFVIVIIVWIDNVYKLNKELQTKNNQVIIEDNKA